jgi:UDPglucose 6-dehydrogenase
MRVSVIGTGYAGTVMGACLATSDIGSHVSITNARKIEMLRRSEMPIYEPGPAELLQLAAARGGIDFATELAAPAAESDVILIAVGTPSRETGEANLCYLEAAARSISWIRPHSPGYLKDRQSSTAKAKPWLNWTR